MMTWRVWTLEELHQLEGQGFRSVGALAWPGQIIYPSASDMETPSILPRCMASLIRDEKRRPTILHRAAHI